MYRISICRSVCARGSIIVSETLATLYEREVPDDIEAMVGALEGDFYEVEKVGDDNEEN